MLRFLRSDLLCKIQPIIFLFGFVPFISSAQSLFPRYADSLFSAYYHQKVDQFRSLSGVGGDVIFLGNSITDGGQWAELFGDNSVKNRGISGDVTTGILNRLKDIVEQSPGKIFLLIGINDLARGIAPDTICGNIMRIVSLIHEHSPATQVYVQSIFPVNKSFGFFSGHTDKEKQIRYINRELGLKAKSHDYTFIDVYKALADREGSLDKKYTNDGLHLLGSGYMRWKHVVYPYVYDLQQKPSVVPRPQSIAWNSNSFPLYRCKTIVFNNDSLGGVGRDLRQILKESGIYCGFHSGDQTDDPAIELRIGRVDVSHNTSEAYGLEVTDKRVIITGNTVHGIFNGIQTLRQLMRDGAYIDGCNITDWPAFSWRGYMVDVGRNYQSLKQLKEQIDVMSQYKLNVFHFHLTEDVAWRLQIKRYPQLTESKTMTRNPGQYYTIANMRELIEYCKDRFITLVPELDMPGHSAAFKRAMGVDMQSDTGLATVKDILKEVDSTYDVPYIHIGADEVLIQNKNFLPEITGFLHGKGKKTLGWMPGGNYGNNTIRQLWNWQNPKPDAPGIYYVDSRESYLDGMDPFNGMIQLFNKRICDADQGNNYLLGGEICAWNDVRIKDEKDFLVMNPIYPAMVTYAERSWQGGGSGAPLRLLGSFNSGRYKAFKEFEERLLDQKKIFFKTKPFPYLEQTQIQWELFGPFENKGNTATQYWPEQQGYSIADSVPALLVSGATVKLHELQGVRVVDSAGNPVSDKTWYAFRSVYSPVDTVGYFWIGFNDIGRSQHVATPPIGSWDRKGGKVWVNGASVPPPQWTYPGRTGEQETPLEDEGYTYRPPTKVDLKKGWNTILVKAPVAKNYRWDWLDPVRWMFTVVQCR